MVWQLWFYRLHWLFFHSVAANTSFSHFFGLFFPNTKRAHCAFLGGDSHQCSNPQHSKPFWTSASSPKPSFLLLFFFLLVKQNQNNLFVAFWTQTDEGAREKPEKENSINSLSLVQQQKPASYPHAFWSEEVKMEVQSSSWALHLQRLPLLHTDVTCCSGPGTRKRGNSRTCYKTICPKRVLQIHVLAQRSMLMYSAVRISTLFAWFPATVGSFTGFF